MLFALTLAIPQLVNGQKANQYALGTPSDGILLYPNPVKNILNISIGNKESVDVKIDIHALDGRKIHTSQHKAEYGKVSVDLSKLNKGLYVLMLTIGNKRTGHKLIKD